MPPRHLYVHVPFCARRCSYCDFAIAVRSKTPVDKYVATLGKELATLGDRYRLATLETVYLGGGTPSRLGGHGIADVLNLVRKTSAIAPDAEITIEANPDDVHDVTVEQWAKAGVNRVSLGSQSFNDDVLRWMHRTHDADQITEAVATLRRGGITNISLDLIFALPADLNRDWKSDLERAIALEPAHISLYGLTIESNTPLAHWQDRGSVVQGTDEKYEEEFLLAHEMTRAAGFDHYEVSNFAQPSYASRHNSAYWTGAEYVGVGPSAHSFDGATRHWNVSAYSEWVRCLDHGEPVIAGEEVLTPDNRQSEAVYLGLRTDKGLEIGEIEVAAVQKWIEAGWASLDKNCLRLTPLGWLRLDGLAADIAARRAKSTGPGVRATPSHSYI
jgi:oxygen-independent coproporphyrinogen-3 oxidase